MLVGVIGKKLLCCAKYIFELTINMGKYVIASMPHLRKSKIRKAIYRNTITEFIRIIL